MINTHTIKIIGCFVLLWSVIPFFTACGNTHNEAKKIGIEGNVDTVLAEWVKKINEKCPLKPVEQTQQGDSSKKRKIDQMTLLGIQLNETEIVFKFQLGDTLGATGKSFMAFAAPMIAPEVIHAAPKYYGKENDPFALDFLKAMNNSNAKIYFHFIGTDGVDAKLLIPKASLPIPYEEGPNDKAFMIDGYSAVKIGEQVWMAENLNIETPKSMCYENNPEFCKRFGRLYTIDEAKTVCPAGWHLPDTAEFNTLLKEVKNEKALISKNHNEWSTSYAGTDDFGFRAHPAGKYHAATDAFEFGHLPSTGMIWCGNCVRTFFWTSTVPSRKIDNWHNRNLGYFFAIPFEEIKQDPIQLFSARREEDEKEALSVRCVKGEPVAQADPFPVTTFADSRDSKNYKQVSIDGTVWMAENLNFVADSSFCYNDDEAMCEKYGRLYTWNAAMSSCPAGWHLPSKEEWEALGSFVQRTGSLLRSKNEWAKPGTDDYHFTVLPAGKRSSTSNVKPANYDGLGEQAHFWSASQKPSWFKKQEMEPEYWFFVANDYYGDAMETASKGEAFRPAYSVRCVKDKE